MTPTDLKQWRTSRHLTQSQSAELVGVKSYRTWQAWERGQNGIPGWVSKTLKLLDNKI